MSTTSRRANEKTVWNALANLSSLFSAHVLSTCGDRGGYKHDQYNGNQNFDLKNWNFEKNRSQKISPCLGSSRTEGAAYSTDARTRCTVLSPSWHFYRWIRWQSLRLCPAGRTSRASHPDHRLVHHPLRPMLYPGCQRTGPATGNASFWSVAYRRRQPACSVWRWSPCIAAFCCGTDWTVSSSPSRSNRQLLVPWRSMNNWRRREEKGRELEMKIGRRVNTIGIIINWERTEGELIKFHGTHRVKFGQYSLLLFTLSQMIRLTKRMFRNTLLMPSWPSAGRHLPYFFVSFTEFLAEL